MLLAVLALGLGIATDYVVALQSRGKGVGGGSTVATGVGVASDGWSVRVWRGRTRDALNIFFTRSTMRQASGEAVRQLPHSVWRGAYRRTLADPAITGAFINGQAYGWPMRSWGGYFINAQPSGSVSAWLYAPGSSQTRVLPYMPILPGMAVNTTVYAAAWLPLLVLLRRLVRRRRMPGLCGECGYDLRGLSGERCPECGATIVALHATGV